MKIKLGEIDKELEELNSELINIMEELSCAVFVSDVKRTKNICFFCKRKCDACQLFPDFRVNVDDLLGLKVDEARILINLSPKP